MLSGIFIEQDARAERYKAGAEGKKKMRYKAISNAVNFAKGKTEWSDYDKVVKYLESKGYGELAARREAWDYVVTIEQEKSKKK
tara:strand:+ start:1611 stop:1862 length:252 start_codon:yes stop_codon:yes gene_type:complete